MSSPSSSVITARCQSCSFELGRSRTACCTSAQCGEIFPMDVGEEWIELDAATPPAACCPFCGGASLVVLQDELTTPLCKHCLAAALTDESVPGPAVRSADLVELVARATLADTAELSRDQYLLGACGGRFGEGSTDQPDPLDNRNAPRCSQCGASGTDNLLPLDTATAFWVGHCSNCQLDYRVTDDSATCPTCCQSAENLETLAMTETVGAAAAAPQRLCRCCGFVNDPATAAAAADARPEATDEATAELRWMQNYLEEPWRFLGCACGNHEPDCFELQASKWPMTSCYCLDCKQPHSRYLWDMELRSDQCPRCNGHQVETDPIAAGDLVIVCLKCDGRVSKRRFDGDFADVRDEVEAELQISGDRSRGGSVFGLCLHCGADGAELVVSSHNHGDILLSQVCTACHSAQLLMGCSGRRDHPRPQPQKAPAGFEELARCCGDLASLHPVEDDADDDLLVCASCLRLVSLAGCIDPAVPKTVSGLRRALKGSYSSGEMGQPYRTVKVTRLDELKPGDQLEFKRRFYSHHAILVETLLNTEQLAVLEYTGESNAPTVVACLTSASSKAHVARSLLALRDVVKSLHRVDYHSLDCFLPGSVIRRAAPRLGEKQYHVGRNNCEHFSNWAKAGVDVSRQADNFKAAGCKALNCPVWDALGGTAKGVIGLASKKPLGLVVDLIQDLREELLQVFSVKQGASRQVLRMVLRLGLKWGIRGLPLLVSMLLKTPVHLDILLQLDALVMKPLAEWAADRLLPIKDAAENGKKSSGFG